MFFEMVFKKLLGVKKMKNRKKKLGISFAIVVAMLFGSVNFASAAAGWQNLGLDAINFYGADFNYNKTSGKVYQSRDGGDIGIKISSSTNVAKTNGHTPIMELKVYEDDGIASSDDLIATFYYKPNTEGTVTKVVNIEKYRDGVNNQAEIQVVYNANFQGTAFVNILD